MGQAVNPFDWGGGGNALPFHILKARRQLLAISRAVCNLSAWEPSAQPRGPPCGMGWQRGASASTPTNGYSILMAKLLCPR